jgi:cation diffusion facilitator family transporter
MSEEHSTSHIIQSLVVNLFIAAVKGIAAFFTGSGAMLAEALHSASDCGNQVLLLIGVNRAKRPRDERHPFGYGRAMYFWSFLVALMIFAGGGVFSAYEGVHKMLAPEPVERPWLGIVILLVSIALEGGATISNIKEINKRRGATSFQSYLWTTKDSDLIVVFGENAAAVLGLALATGALALAWATGDGRWDGAGSAAIGLVLIGVAAFLAVKVKSLLLGESADPAIALTVHATAKEVSEFERVLHLVTMQQGPGEVVVSVKVAFGSQLTVAQVCDAINAFEKKLRAAHPEVRWCFVEPDIDRARAHAAA